MTTVLEAALFPHSHAPILRWPRLCRSCQSIYVADSDFANLPISLIPSFWTAFRFEIRKEPDSVLLPKLFLKLKPDAIRGSLSRQLCNFLSCRSYSLHYTLQTLCATSADEQWSFSEICPRNLPPPPLPPAFLGFINYLRDCFPSESECSLFTNDANVFVASKDSPNKTVIIRFGQINPQNRLLVNIPAL